MTLKITTLIALASISAASLSEYAPNPHNFPYNNPVITHMYTADAAPRVMPDGRVWMVTSVDHENGGGYETMHEYHIFSSSNMQDWIDHGEILHIDDIKPKDTPTTEKWALWAPDIIYREGAYYLYYPVRILHTDKKRPNGGRFVTAYLGVAKSDSLTGKFEVINPRIEGSRGIDPSVFIDDDDTPYIYWGSHLSATLNDTMDGFEEKPVRMDVGTKNFMEAAWMHKRNGVYQLSFHTKYDWKLGINKDNHDDPARKRSRLAYATSDSPVGPFTYQGIMNYEPGVDVKFAAQHPEGEFPPWRYTLSNHGGIVEYHGQEYLFYHTSALSSWRIDQFQAEGEWKQRSVSIDKLNYDGDGKVIPVTQTVESVPAVTVNQAFDIPLDGRSGEYLATGKSARKTIKLLAGESIKFPDIDLGSGYYYLGLEASKFSEKGKIRIHLDAPNGKLIGSITLKSDLKIFDTYLREAKGVRNVFLTYEADKNDAKISMKNIRFFAGAPLKL